MGQTYDLDHGPVVLIQARWKLALATLGSLAFVMLGVWLIPPHPGIDKRTIYGAACIGFFGLCSAFGVMSLIQPNRLSLEPRGLTLQTPFRTRSWAWTDILDINLVRLRHSTIVTLRTEPDARLSRGLYRAMNLPGNAGLPGGWAIRTEALHALLAKAKARWG